MTAIEIETAPRAGKGEGARRRELPQPEAGPSLTPGLDRLPGPLLCILTFAAFTIARWLALKLVLQPENISPIWPASGVALVLMARSAPRRWWWVLIGMALSYATVDPGPQRPLLVSLGFAVAGLSGACLGAAILTKSGKQRVDFSRLSHFTRLLLATVVATSLSACIAVAGMVSVAFHYVPSLFDFSRIWMVSGGLGMLALTPLFLSWPGIDLRRLRAARSIETGCLVLIGSLFALFLFSSNHRTYLLQRPFILTFPFILWASFRTNVFVSSSVALIFSTIAVTATALGSGPFANPQQSVHENLVVLQLVMVGWMVYSLAVAAATAEARHAMAMVAQDRERFRLLAIGSPVGVYQTDEQGRNVYVNERWHQITGQSTDEAAGEGWSKALHPEDAPRVLSEWRRAVAERADYSAEFRVVRPSGEVRWVRTRVGALRIGSGRFSGHVGVVIDITDQREMEESLRASREQLRRVLDALPAAAYTCDAQGQITYFNERAVQLWGRAPKLNHSEDRFCGSLRLYSPDGAAIPHDQCWMAVALREQRNVDGKEAVIERPDGTRRIALAHASPLRDASGKLVGAVNVLLDITERNRSEQRFQLIADAIDEVFWMTDAGPNKTLYISPAYERIWGRSRESLMESPRSFLDAIHPDDRERVEADLPIQKHGRAFSVEYRVIRPDRSVRWISDRGFPVADQNGQVGYYVGVAQDVTARKEFEQALLDASEYNKQIVASVQDGVIVIDLQRRYQVWNRRMEEMSGLPASKVVGRTPMELFPFLKDVGVFEMLERALAGEIVSSPDFPYSIKETGRQGWSWQLMGPLRSADGRIIGAIVTVRDITERKKAQDSLSLFRALIDRTTDGIEVVDPITGQFLDVNEKSCIDSGYSREELLSMTIFDINPQITRESHARTLGTLRHGETRVIESAHRRKDGSIFPVEVKVVYVKLDRQYIVAVVRDISDRKHAEEMLHQSHERFKTLSGATFEGICITEGGRVLDCNEQFARMFGYQLPEMIGMEVEKMIPVEDRQMVLENMRRGIDVNIEHNLIHRDGSTLVIEAHGRPVTLDGRNVRITVVRDVTDQKRAQQRLQQQQAELSRLDRVKTLGQMAAGLAHELNQPLGAILNYAAGSVDMLRQSNASVEKVSPALDSIVAEAKRAGEIIRWLRTFVSRQNPSPSPLDINSLVDESLRLLDHEVRQSHITVRTNLNLSLPQVMGDNVQIVQVLVNLVRNAIEAMRTEGAAGSVLTLRTSQHGGFVRVDVSDQGCGMNPEQSKSMFEPFFTTKSDGMGMGLAISKTIVTECGGELSGKINADGGMTMSFSLPVEKKAEIS